MPCASVFKSAAVRCEHMDQDYLAYALIDAIEDLEDWVVENPHPEVLTLIHTIRRQLVILRRVGHPQREAINTMLRPQSPFFTEQVQVFVRDTRDHIAQIVELVDSSREMASDLADAYLSNVSHRSNEIMKVLTLMASTFSVDLYCRDIRDEF